MSNDNGTLVLTRKTGEAICFSIKDSDGTSTEFKLTLSKSKGEEAKLSFNAPGNVRILREELVEA